MASRGLNKGSEIITVYGEKLRLKSSKLTVIGQHLGAWGCFRHDGKEEFEVVVKISSATKKAIVPCCLNARMYESNEIFRLYVETIKHLQLNASQVSALPMRQRGRFCPFMPVVVVKEAPCSCTPFHLTSAENWLRHNEYFQGSRFPLSVTDSD